jgi:hypothetical protein
MILLHAGDSVLRASQLSWPVLVMGCFALGLALARIWKPRALARAVRRTRRRAAAPAMALAFVFAVLPSVIPYDHLLAPSAHAGEESAVHASHCHTAPGSCSDAPVPSGPGQFIDAAPLMVVPALMAFALFLAMPHMAGIAWRPETPPPLRAAAI